MDAPINPYASPQAELTVSPFAADAANVLQMPGMRATGIGLSLVYYGIIVLIVSTAVMICGFIFLTTTLFQAGPNAGRPPNMFPLIVVSMIGGSGMLLGGLLHFVGQCVCCAAPSPSRARAYAIAAVLSQVCNIGLFVASIAQTVMVGPNQDRPLNVFVYPVWLLSNVLLVLFMYRLAAFIGRGDLKDRARNVFVLGIVLLGLLGAMVFAIVVEHTILVGSLAIVVLIGGLIGLVMFANLTNTLRKILLGKAPLLRKRMLISPPT